jgi:uncharacterized membrane protein YbaN (DUF454 family)
MGKLRRGLLIAAGTACVALGTLGIFLPLLPTTPFLLLAAVCYAHSSPRLLHWLTHNRWFGSYIRNYREGRGIPLREKILTITLLWLTIGVSVVFFVPVLWVKIVLMAIALAVTIHLLRVKTMKAADEVVERLESSAVNERVNCEPADARGGERVNG